MDVSVVIATKDRASALERALESLRRQTEASPFEVVVVDNGSTDRTRAVVESAATVAPVQYCWEAEPNRGLARNRGIAAARGRYIVFCDDDVVVPPRWIAAHVAAHRDAQTVVNGPILNVSSYDAAPKPSLANYSGAFLCTCNASLSKEALQRVGGFDESFDLYGWEDTELGVRLREAGLRWKFAWQAFLWHVKMPSHETLATQGRKAIEKAAMAQRFVEKHPTRRARLATGAYALNLFRARYLVSERFVTLCAAVAASGGAPAWLRAAARGQFLDGLYARALVRAFDTRRES